MKTGSETEPVYRESHDEGLLWTTRTVVSDGQQGVNVSSDIIVEGVSVEQNNGFSKMSMFQSQKSVTMILYMAEGTLQM